MKKNSFKNLFTPRGSALDKGAIYVVVILTLLIFGGYILVGGTLPAKLPKVNTNIVNVVMPSVEPSTSSLQMLTFYGVTQTPYPTQPPIPTRSNNEPTLIECSRNITGSQKPEMIWGFTYDSTAASDNQPALKVFYTNINSLILGSGVVSPMTQHPVDRVANPGLGDTTAKDSNNFVYYPSTFITDITYNLTDVSGDSQAGGLPNTPDIVYGTWKALNTTDPQANATTLTPGDNLPPANGPPGDHNQTYSSEIVWKTATLKTKDNVTLQPGHNYRIQVALHDGANPTNIGVACLQLNLPGKLAPTGTSPSEGERGRVIVQNNVVLTDRNTTLRGATIGIVGDAGGSDNDAYWKYLNGLGLNAVRLGVKLSQAGRTLDQQLPLIDKAVDLAGQNHMYVMINNSVQPGAYDLAELRTFWGTVAARYKDRTHVLYEMTNEPVGWWPHAYTAQNMADLKSVYDIMRAAAPNTHIVLYDFPNLVPDDPATIVAKIASVPGIDWTKASVGFHHYVDKTNSIEQTINSVKAQYPLLMTETNYWVNDPPSQATTVSTLQIEEKLGIGWFSLDGKGGSATHLANEIIPNLRAAGYILPVEN